MNYKLAKQLKEEGFPQSQPNVPKDGYYDIYADGDKRLTSEILYRPTLSELIEACGDVQLNKKRDAPCKGESVDTFTYEAYTEEPKILSFVCSTPEEAVAYLWLELHKK